MIRTTCFIFDFTNYRIQSKCIFLLISLPKTLLDKFMLNFIYSPTKKMNQYSNLIFYRPAPKNEKEIMIAIYEAIDRIFGIVRPRRLLYMAIDGVVS